MTDMPVWMRDRFTLAEEIGRGTCSTVFRARDRLLDRDVAVKVFPVADDPRVEREVALLASLDHPSLVPVYDLGQVDGRAFVVMALFEGGDLAHRLRTAGPLDDGEALLAVASIADALAHVHRAGVLHRDVIPRNVLFDADGRAHLSDFGVALVADAPRITDTGIVVGSAPYLAPEQVRGLPVGPTADVYALGLVMIEALTGEPAYGGTPLEAAQARLERRPVMPPDAHPDVVALLEAMTADDPADRPDAETACRRLRRAALAGELVAADPAPGNALAPLVVRAPAVGSPSRPFAARAAMVLSAAALSVLLAGGAVIASSWPVQDVSATTSPDAALTPPAAASPVVGDDTSEAGEGRGSGTTGDGTSRPSAGADDSARSATGSGRSSDDRVGDRPIADEGPGLAAPPPVAPAPAPTTGATTTSPPPSSSTAPSSTPPGPTTSSPTTPSSPSTTESDDDSTDDAGTESDDDAGSGDGDGPTDSDDANRSDRGGLVGSVLGGLERSLLG